MTATDLHRSGARATIVAFWALSCTVCKAQLPALRRWIADPTLHVVSVHTPIVSDDRDAAQVRAFATAAGLPESLVLDDGALADSFGVLGLPAYFVYDADRRLVGDAAGFQADRRVEALLASLAMPRPPEPGKRGTMAP